MTALIEPGTFSKSQKNWGLTSDTYAKSGRGPYVLLNDDTWLIDLTSSLGQNLIGYGGDFADYVCRQVKQGQGFTLPHYLEYEAADRLADLLGKRVKGWTPEGIGVRFGKAGSDVTTAAVRLARAVTGREWVLTFKNHYHGWGEWSISRTEPGWGILADYVSDFGVNWHLNKKMLWAGVYDLKWQNENNLKGIGKTIAGISAIIFEQPAQDPAPDWYPFLRKWCNDNKALLIADEVVTGLRYAPGGACERYGIEPDLVCMGKALGNGAAVSALVGRREYMEWFSREDPVFWSSTSNGNADDLAAANYVLQEWQERGDKNVARLWQLGDRLIEGCQEAFKVFPDWKIEGYGARSVFGFSDDTERAFFIQRMKERNILANRPNFPNLAMSIGMIDQVISEAGQVAEERAGLFRDEVEKSVEGKLPRILFRGR